MLGHREAVHDPERKCDPLRSRALMRPNELVTCGNAVWDAHGRRRPGAGDCESKRAQSEPSRRRAPTVANVRSERTRLPLRIGVDLLRFGPSFVHLVARRCLVSQPVLGRCFRTNAGLGCRTLRFLPAREPSPCRPGRDASVPTTRRAIRGHRGRVVPGRPCHAPHAGGTSGLGDCGYAHALRLR